jgi:hypothetical protein
MPDPDIVIKKILGCDAMAKNVCLIDSHQMVNAADLPGRLVAISSDRQMPSDLLRYSFRKPGAKTTSQVNPPTAPIQVTRLESVQANSGSLQTWLGVCMAKEDIAEIRTLPLPATSISVDDLDERAITERFSTVSSDIRRGLGIITDVIPYEVLASVCKKTTKKAESGIWYMRIGRDTFARQADELRKYYLVAVYTPIMFYDDIGIITTGEKIVDPTHWQPSKPVKSRNEALSLWLEERSPVVAEPVSFDTERGIGGWGDTIQTVPPKAEGTPVQNGSTDFTTQEEPQQQNSSSNTVTTVVPE